MLAGFRADATRDRDELRTRASPQTNAAASRTPPRTKPEQHPPARHLRPQQEPAPQTGLAELAARMRREPPR